MFGGCAKASGKETRTDFYLNTVVSITIYGNYNEEIFDGCFRLADKYENMFSRTIEGSDIWNINHSGGECVTVQQETAELLEIALSYAEMSDGLVDPTIGTLSALWNFGDENQGIVPSDEHISEALSHVDYRNVVLDGTKVTLKDSSAQLDLGFIAKGYIADRIKDYLLQENVSGAIINLGGNVLTLGSKPDGTAFKVGIQKPFGEAGDYVLTVDIDDESVVTSGNYERYFVKNGEIYHHILSTENGYPAESGISAVTVITENSVDGDALSTLLFTLGSDKGRKLADSLQNVEAVFIAEDGTVIESGKDSRFKTVGSDK